MTTKHSDKQIEDCNTENNNTEQHDILCVNLMLVNTAAASSPSTSLWQRRMVAPLTLLELIIVETNHSVCLGRRDRSADSETETTCV